MKSTASSVEPLEVRIAPAITVATTGVSPNFTVAFTDDGTGQVDNRLELQFIAGTSQLGFSINGGAVITNVGSPNGGGVATFDEIDKIRVFMGAGDDELVFTCTGFSYTATVRPDPANSLETDMDLTRTGSANPIDFDLRGVELLSIGGANNNDNLTVQSGQGDNSARIQNAAGTPADEVLASDLLPRVEFAGLNTFTYARAPGFAGTNVVTFATHNLAGATTYQASLDNLDTLIVEGADAIGDLFQITRPAAGQVRVTENSVAVTETGSGGTARVEVRGLGGDDQLNVNVGVAVGSDVISNPIFFDGGTGKDLLDVFGAPPTSVDEVIYSTGLAPGASTLRYEDAGDAGLMSIESANLEAAIDLVPAATLTTSGTDAAEAITYSPVQIIGAGGRLAIGSAGVLEFSNKTTLVINSLGGADLITLANPTIPAGLTSIAVDGGNSSADTLLLTGTTSFETFEYQPTGPTDGTLLYTVGAVARPRADFHSIEAVQIDGGSDLNDDALFFTTVAGADIVVLTPGATPDSGTLQAKSFVSPGSTPALTFTRLGDDATVTVQDAGASRADTLEYQGTNVSDIFTVTTTGQVRLNSQVLVDPTGVNTLLLQGLAGNDTFTVFGGGTALPALAIDGGASTSDVVFLIGTGAAGESVTIAPNASNPASQDVIGLGPFITTAGVETLRYTGAGGGGALIVNTGPQNNTIRVAGGDASLSGFDQVTSDSLPAIQFTGLDTFTLDPGAGVDVATFVTSSLGGALPGNYQYNPEFADVLVIEGQEGSDSFTVTRPSDTLPVAVQDNNALVAGVTVTALSSPGRVQINTLGGDDLVTVDVGISDVVGVPITYDGGLGSDQILVSGTPALGVDNVGYTPGAQTASGRLLYQDAAAATLMTIDFVNLEQAIDVTPSVKLTVNGTDAPNAISYTAAQNIDAGGRVAVDNFVPIEFSNKTQLVIHGLGGRDDFSSHNATTPLGLTNITFNGGEGQGDVFASGQSFGAATSYAAGKTPSALATGDVNGDGVPDLVVSNTGSGSISVLLGNGAGGFAAATSFSAGGKKPGSLVLADLDGNGSLDLAVTIAGTKSLAVFLNDGTGNFGTPTLFTTPPKLTALAAADLTGDDRRELVAISAGTKVAVLLNDGAGSFSAQTPVATGGKGGVDLVLADFNHDNLPDVAVANSASNDVSLLLGNGGGALAAAQRFATGTKPSALAAGDFDGDGNLDLAVTHSVSRFVGVLFGNGSASGAQFDPRVKIATPGSKAPRDLVIADLDADGRSDLIIANGGANSFSVLLGLAGGAFRRPIETIFSDEAGNKPAALALSDFNADGLLDVALVTPVSGDVHVVLRVAG